MGTKIKIIGFSIGYKFKDADENRVAFTQKYNYFIMKCPKCKGKLRMLCPAINKCSCGCLIGFCALNDRENRLYTFDIDKLKESIE